MRVERRVKVENEHGLHARPAMQLVECASGFESDISLTRADGTESPADAKSVMQVITLAATQDTEIDVVAEGDDAEAAVAEIATLFSDKFGENA